MRRQRTEQRIGGRRESKKHSGRRLTDTRRGVETDRTVEKATDRERDPQRGEEEKHSFQGDEEAGAVG